MMCESEIRSQMVSISDLTNQPIQLNKLNQPQLEPRRRSPFAEGCFAGGIFGDVLFQLFAPQGLKCPAAAIQRVNFCKIGKPALQITKIYFTAGHTRIFRHLNLLNGPLSTISLPNHLNDLILNPDKPENA
jgi:hypothetical protein